MNPEWIIASCICAIFFLQIIISGPSLQLFVNLLYSKYLIFRWKSVGFLLPALNLRAQDIHLDFPGFHHTDLVILHSERLYSRLSWPWLFLGRLHLVGTQLLDTNVKYVNRVVSWKKLRYLPKRGFIRIRNGKISNGQFEVRDETMNPKYEISIRDIQVDGWEMDLGAPLTVLFHSLAGQCSLGKNGKLKIMPHPKDRNRGQIRLCDISWSELAGLKIIPLPILKSQVDLTVNFHNIDRDHTHIQGKLRHVGQEETEDAPRELQFDFSILWNDYALPFDLALRKLLLAMFVNLDLRGVVGLTLQKVTKGLVQIFKGRFSNPSDKETS